MPSKFEVIHTVTKATLSHNPSWNMPYVPGIKVLQGSPLYISGVNAAPIYHDHPHRSEEFNQLDFDPENQVRRTMENLSAILQAAGGSLRDVVQIFVFIVNVKKNGDPIGQVISRYFDGHLPTSTVVGIADLLTDSRLILEITAVAYI
jgi:2-iminobutanoate/2-iminopropanoate deaminase